MAGQVFKRTARSDPIWFAVELEDGTQRRFDCRDQVPGGVILGVTEIVSGGGAADERAAGMAAVSTVQRLLKAAIIKPQQKLFWRMVNGEDEDPDDDEYVGGIIDVPQMMDIAMALAEAYTERPTGGSSEPGSQTTTDGSDSRVGAQPGPSMYSRSPQLEPSISSSTGASSRP